MPPTPPPSPVHVIVDSGPAEWWQILAALGPLAVLLGALLAAFIGWNTLRQRTAADANSLAQKREADNRAEWWKRTQWAIDSSMSDEPGRAKLGLKVISMLAESTLAGPEELKIITAAWADPLEVAKQALDVTLQGEGTSATKISAQSGRVDDRTEPGDNESTIKDKE